MPIDLLHDGRLHVGNGQPRPLLGSPQQGLVRLLPLRPVLVQVLAEFNSSNWVRTRVWSLVSLLKTNTVPVHMLAVANLLIMESDFNYGAGAAHF